MTTAIGASLEVDELVLAYGQAVAVDHLSLVVEPGSCVGVVGANGAGKSSLLRCIAGMHRPIAGSIRLDGRDIAGREPWAVARLGLRLVPENRELFWNLSVAENLRLGAHGMPNKKDAVDVAVQFFPALGPLWNRPARLLSGGEQQMLAIGRALVGYPRVVMLDEPTLGLAPIMVAQLIRSLRAIRTSGVSLLIAEQNLHLPREICDDLVILRLGRVTAIGPPSVALTSSALEHAFLGV